MNRLGSEQAEPARRAPLAAPPAAAADRPFVSYFDYRHYAPVLPPLREGRDANTADVAIVGGGPIGFSLALALARQGVRSVVLEADDSVCLGSRAGCVTRRTLEIFHHLDVAEATMRQGLPWSEGWSYYGTDEVFHLQVPSDALARYPNLVNIQQQYVEQFLLDQIKRLPHLIELRWCSRASGFATCSDGIELQVSTPAGDYAMRSRWVVACDGARSEVRRALGLRMVGTRYEGRYVIVDIKMKSALPPGRRAWFDPPSNPGSTLLLHKHSGDLWRFDYQLADDEDATEATRPEKVLERIRSHLELIGETAPWNPVWISLYSASCLTLESYRQGRVLFAGDAAHLVPIFGVRGMNSGIDDTYNLAWKLALVCRGAADESLLDSYSDERVAATRENMRHASKGAEFMAPPSPAFARMRSAVLGLARTEPWVRSLINPRQSTAVGFPDSPLNVADEDEFSGGPRPGMNVDDLPVGAAHLSTLIGPRFTALRIASPGETAAESSDMVEGVELRTITLDAEAALCARLGARPGTIYLFRPDGHVMARWRRYDPQRIRSALRRACRPEVP